MSYRDDREWSDRYLDRIKSIVGPLLLKISPDEIDQKQAADLIVLGAKPLTIACRVRKPGFATKYPDQFTLRSKRDSGHITELRKIVEGWADWGFYGHAVDDISDDINPWWVVDFRAFRAQLTRHYFRLANGKVSPLKIEDRGNGDGTHFASYHIGTFDQCPGVIVSSSVPFDDTPTVA